MTSHEKAQKLYWKFYNHIEHGCVPEMRVNVSKECCRILCDEVKIYSNDIEFWNEVKIEIENL